MSDFGSAKTSGEATDSTSASAISEEAEAEDGDVTTSKEILEAIKGLKDDFSDRFDGIMSAIDFELNCNCN
ncbi:hypothetical protein JOB18_047459 [Solea senegalensis]|uniref:Uncharacterized protein n=1 Tax=Solea senegalensis TaxID=28829 RepID=A0AAV6QLJ0_SOLSE|nr:hypothetical protein JOB18_047459 [Solea senegalensis]